jgi:outer membrane biosynthesis protein TonB
VRGFVYALPIVLSLALVLGATTIAGPQTRSLWAYLGWWLVVSLAATVVVWAVFALTRRLLPLGTLFELSLVFPDEAPSRFSLALSARTVQSLEERVRIMREAREASSTQEAAEILLRLVAALDHHDRITSGHAERVRAYSAALGRELGLTDDELDRLNWAALLHDIGKLGIPPEILNKAGQPTEDEWQSLRRHPLLGEELVDPLREWLGEWIGAVGGHHERWDGTGYPRGLAEDEIPRAGRIVAIADAYDVITSARSYKKPTSAVDARAELVRGAGTQFDPRFVRAFVGLSLGSMRFVVGPLSWLSHAPLLARIPLTQSLGATLGGVAAVAATAAVASPAVGTHAPGSIQRVATAPSAVAATPSAELLSPKGRRPTRALAKPRAEAEVASSPSVPAPDDPGTPAPESPKTPAPEPSPPAPPKPPVPVDSPVPRPPKVDPLPAPPIPLPPPANQAPSFVAGPAQAVLEDAGVQSVRWASSISPGPDSDKGQTVRFSASTDSPGLFAVQPAVAADGTLTYTPAADAFGVAGVTVTASDDGGTIGGGVDTSSAVSFTITVQPVNDAPSFSLGGSQLVLSALGAQKISGFVSKITCGPPSESSQRASLVVTTDKPGLFLVPPAISSDGTLTYTPRLLGLGVATVTVYAVDDGGTANGGADTSPQQTFTITIA